MEKFCAYVDLRERKGILIIKPRLRFFCVIKIEINKQQKRRYKVLLCIHSKDYFFYRMRLFFLSGLLLYDGTCYIYIYINLNIITVL